MKKVWVRSASSRNQAPSAYSPRSTAICRMASAMSSAAAAQKAARLARGEAGSGISGSLPEVGLRAPDHGVDLGGGRNLLERRSDRCAAHVAADLAIGIVPSFRTEDD